MVEQTPRTLDAVFHALGDATRRRMLRELSREPMTVSRLAQPFDMSLAAASKHIQVLERAGMIRREIRGRTHLCHLEPGPLASAQAWLDHYARFWQTHLDRLEALLVAPEAPPPRDPHEGDKP
ncbi:MAG: winged helix-turn-helix transcriptional regulator [Rhodocyclaceae bacterium]|nr:winged helix-turn-helix transcriptional regulator [Rhodocyclaceae bacterium]